MDRRPIVDGEYFLFSSAVRADGKTIPAEFFFEQLQKKTWPIPDTPIPDDKQPNFFHQLMAMIIDFSEGREPDEHRYNYLEDGVWEFKIDSLRLTFYDTDGKGSFKVPPLELNHRREMNPSLTKYILPIDDIDSDIRLGYAFSKDGAQTSPKDINLTMIVREEDLTHDKP